MKPPHYTYVVGGRYWYFRRAGLLEALIGEPGELAFEQSYDAAIVKAEKRIAARERDRARRARNARERRAQTESDIAGTIYFIGGKTGPIKIGFTTDIASRLLRLQMNSPKPLRVIASYSGTRRDEMLLHRRHEAARLHGEWFKRTVRLMGDIAEILLEAREGSTASGTDTAQTTKLLTAQDSCANSFRSHV